MKKDTLTSSFLALRDKLHLSAMKILKDDEDANDALQDTFFRLWRKGGIESDTEARNKLFVSLRNICIDRLRRHPIQSSSAEELENIAVQPDSGEDMEKLESLLTIGLTEIQKEIYFLLTKEGMEYDDIAKHLKMSIDAVRMQMSRARSKIRNNYQKLNR